MTSAASADQPLGLWIPLRSCSHRRHDNRNFHSEAKKTNSSFSDSKHQVILCFLQCLKRKMETLPALPPLGICCQAYEKLGVSAHRIPYMPQHSSAVPNLSASNIIAPSSSGLPHMLLVEPHLPLRQAGQGSGTSLVRIRSYHFLPFVVHIHVKHTFCMLAVVCLPITVRLLNTCSCYHINRRVSCHKALTCSIVLQYKSSRDQFNNLDVPIYCFRLISEQFKYRCYASPRTCFRSLHDHCSCKLGWKHQLWQSFFEARAFGYQH